jgi:drug/metabolite transporter (DMT)-like permease
MLFLFLIPIIFAIANLLDKILVFGEDEASDPGALIAISGLFAFLISIPLGLWMVLTGEPFAADGPTIVLIANELLMVFAIWIYFTLLKEEETSKITCWFQTIPIFGVIGAFLILKEVPEWYDFFGILLLVIGGFLLSFRDGYINRRIVFWMIMSSGLYAIYDVIFAAYAREISPISAIFIILCGKAFWGCLILVGKSERSGFMIGLRTKLKFQAVTELANLGAYTAMCWAILLFPVAYVQGICSSQPLFVLMGAVLCMKYKPEIFQEEIGGASFRKKVIAITIMIAGGIFLS